MEKFFSKFDNNYVIISLVALLFFFPFLGKVHLFDWDEINFAESAREMIVSADYLNVQINFQPFWEKPPLFIWMQTVSMKLFGINEFAARFPNAVCGVITLLLLYFAGKRHFDKKFGLLWALAYFGSILPFFYFRSGIIDPWFNLFIFAGVFTFYEFLTAQSTRQKLFMAGLAGAFIGLGILTKGPVSLLVFGLTTAIFWVVRRFRLPVKISHLTIFTFFLALTGGSWFILQIANGNYAIIVDFIEYQIRLLKTEDAGHGGFLLYHFVVVFFGVFPASILALAAWKKGGKFYFSPQYKDLQMIMIILLAVVLILFTIVRTKILHYSSLTYFPLTFLAALVLWHLDNRKRTFNRFSVNTITFLGFFYGLLIIAFPILIIFLKEWFIELDLIADPFAVANLQAEVNWTGLEGIGGLILIAGVMLFRRYKDNILLASRFIFFSTALFINLTLFLFIPRVESYTQRAAIEFYEGLIGKNVYINTLGFKSYAHLFYARQGDHGHQLSGDNEWLLTGNIDKDVYFVSKIQRKVYYLEKYPQLQLLYEKNGFVFYKREKINTINP